MYGEIAYYLLVDDMWLRPYDDDFFSYIMVWNVRN